jgi:hypothetical protein
MTRSLVSVARGAALATLAALVLSSCRGAGDAAIANGDDPLAALTVDVESTRYTTRYWSTQADSNPTLWSKAQAYCEQQRAASSGQKVNCGAVLSAKFERGGRSSAPARPRRDPQAMGF